MNQHKNIFVGLILVCLLGTLSTPGLAQSSGTIRGRVTLETSDKPVHNVTVTIIQLKRATETDDSGMYEFKDVPPGKYDVVAHLDRVPDVVQKVQVNEGSPSTLDFELRLRIVGEQVTITASAGEETSFNSIQSVTSLTSVQLAERNPQSLGEALVDPLPGG